MSKEVLSRLENGDLPLDFNWNKDRHAMAPFPKCLPTEPTATQVRRIRIVSEDLRDGLHGVSEYPSVQNMNRYVTAMNNLGIDTMTVGIYPGKENIINSRIKELLANMRDQYPDMTPTVLLQAQQEALNWGIECKQINPNLQAIVFMGTAPSRLLVQEWTQDFVLGRLAWATQEAIKEGIPVIGATEHTTQTPPDFLRKIIVEQVNNGASAFCAADTIGTARPVGTYRLVKFIKRQLKDMGREDVLVDWHGHRDMGNDTQNAMTAIAAGANRIHTVARGIGERAGNTRMEAVLINCTKILQENGEQSPWNMVHLSQVLDLYNEIVHVPPPSHGELSTRAFDSSLGIHTDAMYKALTLANEARKEGKTELADRLDGMARTIYSAIDPKSVGREQEIHVGPWSGSKTIELAHILFYGEDHPIDKDTTQNILSFAKKLGRELTMEELRKLFGNGSNH